MLIDRAHHEELARKWQAFAASYASSAQFDRFMFNWYNYSKAYASKKAARKRGYVVNARKAAECARTARYHLTMALTAEA